MIKKFKNLLVRNEIIKKINDLDILRSGVDDEGDAFVVLKNGTKFYGPQRKYNRDKYLYKLLKSSTKEVLKSEAIQVAMDVVIRYVEGGLKYGGPKKQSYYKVKEGDHVAEMGAYQGFCSLKLAQQVGPSGKVVCIEPNRDNFRLLKKNMTQNGYKHVHLVNYGVWDSDKLLSFNIKNRDGQSSSIEMNYTDSDVYKIQAKTLDNIFSEINVFPSDFVIVQLNGAEINALKGLNNLSPKHFAIAARYDTKGVDAAIEIRDFLINKGYNSNIVNEDYVFASLNNE
jgi:FkbM family methyltransferase